MAIIALMYKRGVIKRNIFLLLTPFDQIVLFVCVCVSVWVSVWVCASVTVLVCECVYVRESVCECECVCQWQWQCDCECGNVCMWERVCVSVCVSYSVSVSVCMWERVCVLLERDKKIFKQGLNTMRSFSPWLKKNNLRYKKVSEAYSHLNTVEAA